MNTKVVINPILIIKARFSHKRTYRVLYYIMCNYDHNIGYIELYRQDMMKFLNDHKDISYKVAIDELIYKDIIERDKINKHKYYVNKQVIIKTHK
jgi:hypothetical protein